MQLAEAGGPDEISQKKESTEGEAMGRKLIYDVGAHNGADTRNYLLRGYDVVAVEADPGLAKQLKECFADRIAAGQLRVAECGIAEMDGELPFYICPELTEWNSFDKDWASKRGKRTIEVRIRARRFESLLEEYGIPQFLKIDIEGCDALCIRALTANTAPEFVSFEADQDSLALVAHLCSIGYRRFVLVNQWGFGTIGAPRPGTLAHLKWSGLQTARAFSRRHLGAKRVLDAVRPKRNRRVDEQIATYGTSSSGPPPMERRDGWQNLDQFAYTWTSIKEAGLLESSWYDIHATR